MKTRDKVSLRKKKVETRLPAQKKSQPGQKKRGAWAVNTRDKVSLRKKKVEFRLPSQERSQPDQGK